MTDTFLPDPSLLPSPEILNAFSELTLEGILMFRTDGRLVFANAVARASLCRDGASGAADFEQRIARVLPADALAQARAKGRLRGKQPKLFERQ